MALLSGLTNVISSIWSSIEGLFLLIIVILYTVLFFVVQYYLIRAYIWIFKKAYYLLVYLRILKPFDLKDQLNKPDKV